MDVSGARTLGSVLTFHAQTIPFNTFLMYEDQSGDAHIYTYDDFDKLTNRVASSLERLGIGCGDRINLHLGNRPEFLAAWLAAAKFGVSVVPTNPVSTEPEWEYLLRHSESKATVIGSEAVEGARKLRDRIGSLREIILCGEDAPGTTAFWDLISSGDPAPVAHAVVSSCEAALMYTSGMTSKPKGVVLTHANYIYAGEAHGRHICLRPDDRYLVVLPLFHASGQTHSIIPALVFGASAVLMHRFSASNYFNQALKYEVTIGSLFAAPIRMILSAPYQPQHRQTRMRLTLYAQNVTHAQLDEWERRYTVPLIQIWGMTETMSLPIMEPLYSPRKRMSMGMPIHGCDPVM